jgi:hypothetical protein
MDKLWAVMRAAPAVMRRLCVTAALVVALTSASSGAMAFYDGDKLYNYCHVSMGQPELLYCQAYIAAIADAMGSGNAIYGFKACMGLDVSLGKAMNAAVQFLMTHPEIRHHEAAWLVAQALAQAFPCQRQ